MCQPAFEYKHFELFEAHELLALYPEHQTLIDQYALKEITEFQHTYESTLTRRYAFYVNV